MQGFIYFLLFVFTFGGTDTTESNYSITFLKIDNKAELIINDSIIYSSGVIDDNPDLNELYSKIYFGNYLTPARDEVIIRLYNAKKPYKVDQNDKHWEIEYVIYKDEKEFEYMWDSEDDYAQGLVFEEKYYL